MSKAGTTNKHGWSTNNGHGFHGGQFVRIRGSAVSPAVRDACGQGNERFLKTWPYLRDSRRSFLENHGPEDLSLERRVITQQQLDTDVETFRQGLLTAFRAHLDVVFVGEIRDLEVLQLVLTLAETGHLVFATVHTESASETVRRLMEILPESQRPTVRRSLSRNLAAIISQRLLPRADRRARVAANEILVADSRIRRMIFDGVEDLTVAIEAGRDGGMQTMDDSVLELYRREIISHETTWAILNDLSRLGPAEVSRPAATGSPGTAGAPEDAA